MIGVMRCCSRLPREVMDATTLQTLKGQDGQNSEQPDLAVCIFVHCRRVGQDECLPTQTIL